MGRFEQRNIARDRRLAKPAIVRIIGEPPPRPARPDERPHPETSSQLHTTAVCLHDEVRRRPPAKVPGHHRLTRGLHVCLDMRRPARAGFRLRLRNRQLDSPAQDSSVHPRGRRSCPPAAAPTINGRTTARISRLRGDSGPPVAFCPPRSQACAPTLGRLPRPSAGGHDACPPATVLQSEMSCGRAPAGQAYTGALACPRAPDRLPVRLKPAEYTLYPGKGFVISIARREPTSTARQSEREGQTGHFFSVGYLRDGGPGRASGKPLTW